MKILTFATTLLLLAHNIKAEPQTGDTQFLEKLNLEIAEAEDRGDTQWLDSILASEMAFRRANGLVVDRDQFLSEVKARGASQTKIESIQFFGQDRAIATCIVTLKVNGKDAKFHNLLLFIREGSTWKLLSWANEKML